MATAMRCSVIAESRQWLDCFYGSAQQMRQSLKLVSAPDTQLQLTQNPPSGGTVHDADIRVSVLSAAVRCDNLDDDRKWLDCYYGSGDPMRVKLSLQPFSPAGMISDFPGRPGSASGSATTNGVATAADRSFKPTGNPTRFPLVSQVKSYAFDQSGMFTIALANGQIWRQISGDTSYAGHLSASEAITISRGAIGSYNLRIGKHPQYFKVRRTQ